MDTLRKLARKIICLIRGHDPIRHFTEMNVDQYSPSGAATSLDLSGRSVIECVRCGCTLSVSRIALPEQCKRKKPLKGIHA